MASINSGLPDSERDDQSNVRYKYDRVEPAIDEILQGRKAYTAQQIAEIIEDRRLFASRHTTTRNSVMACLSDTRRARYNWRRGPNGTRQWYLYDYADSQSSAVRPYQRVEEIDGQECRSGSLQTVGSKRTADDREPTRVVRLRAAEVPSDVGREVMGEQDAVLGLASDGREAQHAVPKETPEKQQSNVEQADVVAPDQADRASPAQIPTPLAQPVPQQQPPVNPCPLSTRFAEELSKIQGLSPAQRGKLQLALFACETLAGVFENASARMTGFVHRAMQEL